MKAKQRVQPSIWTLIKGAFKFYSKSFSAGFIFIFIAALLQEAYQYMDLFALSATSHWVLFTLVVLISIYFWSAAIYSINQVFVTNSLLTREVLAHSLKKYPKVLSFVSIYVLTYLVMAQWLHVLNYWGSLHPIVMKSQGIINLFFAGLPLLLFLLLMLMALPLIITENLSVFRAFKHSIIMVWKSRLKAVFALFVSIMFILYLVMPHTKHATILSKMHLDGVFTLLVYIALIPLIINYMILLTRQLYKSS